MKISEKTRIIVLLSIGIIFIAMGLIQGVFDVEMNKNVSDNISFILMMAALFVFFSNKTNKNKAQQQNNQEQNEQNKQQDQTETAETDDKQDKYE